MGFSVRRFSSRKNEESLLNKKLHDLEKLLSTLREKEKTQLQLKEEPKKVVSKKRKEEEEETEEASWSSILDINLEEEDPYKELEVIIQNKQQPIFKLPSSLKMGNVKAYEPQVVSIGPYHNGKPHLIKMEIHKKRALVHFIKRSGVPLETYINELMKVVDELKSSYAQLDKEWIDDDKKFIELMIVDGCFLLEFLAVGTKVSIDDYARSDPMFSFHGKTVNYDSAIKDLLTVENQLPYLVLTTLLSVARPQEDAHETISHMMLCHNEGPRRHILDRYAERVLEAPDLEIGMKLPTGFSASELYYQFGIRFKKVSGYRSIRFDYKQAVLLLPPIMIHDDHQNPFLNMRAFEVWVSKDLKFHSFIYLIKTLVKSVKDVKLLRYQGIIVGPLDETAVLKSIQVFTKDIGMFNVDSEPIVALQDMNEYCNQGTVMVWRMCRIWITNLYENYFSNPWTIISLVAAAILMALTVVQTYYTVISYKSSN
ncbi:hypothetical protein C5167_018744 [Papaver somniferum]|uniref:Uncharacterized protein n=1 Tax=Papaver somniferum TaxID=3469 RepID=A0A4Y7IRH3_PAPSO|nr:UPF0481 protein At3g47200-like [Papaver somniferum]RZC50321.1 hypothetical protein C5167_018744 [Papaver somniferum]